MLCGGNMHQLVIGETTGPASQAFELLIFVKEGR